MFGFTRGPFTMVVRNILEYSSGALMLCGDIIMNPTSMETNRSQSDRTRSGHQTTKGKLDLAVG